MSAGGESPLWREIKRVVEDEGLVLFDLDTPGSQSGGVVRVYVARPPSSASPRSEVLDTEDADESAPAAEDRNRVSFEDCVRISKKLLDLDEASGIIPEGCLLEVSSPGVNRRLRRPEHFEGAVGERVKVKFRSAQSGETQVVTGVIGAVQDGCLTVLNEQNDQRGSAKGPRPAGRKKGRTQSSEEQLEGAEGPVQNTLPVSVKVAISEIKEARVDFLF